jgi:hypothetical protein
MSILIYTASQHRFFDDLVTMLASLASFGIATNLYAQGPESLELDRSVGFGGCTIKTDLIFDAGAVMPILIADKWPAQIELRREPHECGIPDQIGHTSSSGEVKGLTGLIMQSSFIHYYETMVPAVEARFTSDRSQWPPVWNFGRVVRNAFAHGGNIHFTNQNAASVSWHGITYGPSDNGRQIMYRDVAQVEVIFLMEEMDAAV